MKQLLAIKFLLLLIFPNFLSATNYYISSSGNDQNSGTNSNNPWRTIDKVNGANLNPGDSVLFKRGDTFYGQIDIGDYGTENNPLVIGAYGSGEKPIISGAIPTTNWQTYNSNIWYTTLTNDRVYQLIVNGSRMTLARYPNQGFLTIDQINNSRQFRDNALTQPSGQWNGANARFRTSDYTWETTQVSSYDNGLINLADGINTYEDWGYYLDNKFEALDAPGEWYYDEGSNRLYYYPLNGQDPNNLSIMASVHEYGVKGSWNREGITVRDLRLQYQGGDGIWFFGAPCKNNSIIHCDFYYQQKSAAVMMGDNIKITNNYFEGCAGQGVNGYELSNSEISHNEMRKIGLTAGIGISGIGGMIGIYLDRGDDIYIGYNTMDSLGYNGITCNTANSLVERNIVRNALLHLDDGAGIYCWGEGVHHTTIKNNFVYNVIGNNEALPGDGFIVQGIYLDNYVYEISVDSNTVVNSHGSGVLINADAHDNHITHNIIYGSHYAGLEIAEWSSGHLTRNMTITDNVFYALDEKAKCISLRSSYNQHDQLAYFDRNYYHNPFSTQIIERGSFYSTPSYAFEQWQDEVPSSNQNSKTNNYFWSKYQVTNRVSDNLIANGEFSDDDSGWTAWPGNGNSVGYRVEDAGLDGGAYYFEMLNGWPEQNGYPISNDIPGGFDANKYYELSFSIRSEQMGNVTVTPRRNTNPYNNLGGEKMFAFSTSRRDYSNIFQVDETADISRLDFKISYDNDRQFYMDNVELYEVEVANLDPTQKAKLFTNETNQTLEIMLDQTYLNLDNEEVSGSITLPPYSSEILIATNDINPTFPVELLSFEGEWIEDDALLTWETTSELNNSHFTIEKSIDGIIFEPFGQVASRGNSENLETYELWDAEPFNGKTFYRLKQTDLDGTFSYLGIIELNASTNNQPKMRVFPNPVTNREVNLSINHLDQENINELYLINAKGQVVYEIRDRRKHLQINLPQSIPNGIYWLIVDYGEGIIQKPLVIMSM